MIACGAIRARVAPPPTLGTGARLRRGLADGRRCHAGKLVRTTYCRRTGRCPARSAGGPLRSRGGSAAPLVRRVAAPKLPPDAPVFDLDPRYLRYRMQYRDSVYSFFPGWCRRWRDICVTCTTTTGDDRICTHATPCGALSSTPWCEEFDLSRVPDLCRTWTDGTYRYDRTGRLGRERTRVAASIFCVDEFERKR